MFEIAVALGLVAALTALICFWSSLLARLTELAARYLLPMPPGLPEQAGRGESKPLIRHSF